MPRKKRIILPGFPKEFIFETRDALNEYLSGERITCLLCGQEYRQLDAHLRAQHGIDSDAYKERYGIPFTYGLRSGDYRKQSSEFMMSYFEQNPGERERRSEQVANFRPKGPQRKKPEYWKKERTKYSESDFREFGRRVISGRTGTDVQNDDDMPNKTHIFWYMKRNPRFRKWWETEVQPHSPTGLSAKDRAKKG